MAPEDRILDARNMSLDEWLALLRRRPKGVLFDCTRFPTNTHRDLFFDRLPELPDETVESVLRSFRVRTGSTEVDMIHAEFVLQKVRSGTAKPEDLTEHDHRLLRHGLSGGRYPAWEGIQWVLDLLPARPRAALQVLEAFLSVRVQDLKDNYLDGLFDAMSVIRQRYVESLGTSVDATTTLTKISWREMEWLAGALYSAMGFDVDVTDRSRDSGIDVLASGADRGAPVHLVVQVKHKVPKAKGRRRRVGVDKVRELLGAMDSPKATGAVLIATAGVTRDAKKLVRDHPRLDAVGPSELIKLLNEYCGSDWHLRVDRLLAEIQRQVEEKRAEGESQS